MKLKRETERMWLSFFLFLLVVVPGLSGIVLEGSDTSFAQYHQFHGGENKSLEFEFRTDQHDALLLYTDHKPSGEYLQVSLVDGAVRLRFRFASDYHGSPSAGLLIVQKEAGTDMATFSDGAWHNVLVARKGVGVALVIDRIFSASTTVAPTRDAMVFGNSSSNSFVFIGGLPSWFEADSKTLQLLSLPQALLEPRLAGAVRRVRYADATDPDKEKQQKMMAFKGVRNNHVNSCDIRNPCLNGGRCLPTDSGSLCSCRNIDFTGASCDQALRPPEVTFLGGEYISLDLANNNIDPIVSMNDHVSLYFRTRRTHGLLFYAGNDNDFMSVSLEDGAVALKARLGTGVMDTKISPNGVAFNDNEWHKVIVERKLSQHSIYKSSCHVILTVDDVHTESWTTPGRFTTLASSQIFVGGTEIGYEPKPEDSKVEANFVGCLKKVMFKADSLILNLLRLSENGNPLISSVGHFDTKCRDVGIGKPQPYRSEMSSFFAYQRERQDGVISFAREEAFLVLPSWKVSLSGVISLRFRTTEEHGLLLYNTGQEQDYFAMELLDGHLYVHMDLGSGRVKVRASRVQLNDGDWHQVEVTMKRNQGRITVDGDTEAFETPGAATQLDLTGNLFVGSVDYMDPYLVVPPSVWTATLRHGFVGCMRDLVMNGATFDLVSYAHQQDVGSIRSSCHKMPGQCHDKPCMHGGKCKEGWNRYICDCSNTAFSGATCGNAATTLKFEGTNSMSLTFMNGMVNEADDIQLRFRTKKPSGILLQTSHDRSGDKLEVIIDEGRLKLTVQMGSSIKTMFVGRSLNDDVYHSMVIKRFANRLSVSIDNEEPVRAEVPGSETLLSYSKISLGGNEPEDLLLTSPTGAPGFVGSMQQFVMNGQAFFDLATSGQLMNHRMNAILVEPSNPEETVHHAVSFTAQTTFIGLPQMKAYNSIDIRFQFRTFEQNALLMYNAGKASDFIALELIKGRLHYTLNLGYGPITIKDNGQGSLADNKWHRVIIGRPSRYRHTLMVDGHIATASTKGDNYHLDLDGILYLGGVRSSMYLELPRPLVSRSGYQGCFSSFEVNGELMDPVKHALVPSHLVEEGCEEAVTYQWGIGGGVVSYSYPGDKRPDTSRDILSVGFITPSFDAVLVRIDSQQGLNPDFVQMEIMGGKVFVNYNLGSKDITIGDITTKVNDGKYHVVRFTRSGANSTLQIDDHDIQTKYPQGNRHLTVFNDQASIHVGGIRSSTTGIINRPFVGVMAGVTFNGLRPLDLAKKASMGSAGQSIADLRQYRRSDVFGDVKLLNNIPFDYKSHHPDLFSKEAMQSMMDKVYVHRGDTLISAGQNDDTTNAGFFSNCDDEEDCYAGSGSGEGPHIWPPGGTTGIGGGHRDEEEIYYPRGADSHYVPMSPSPPPSQFYYSTTQDWSVLLNPDTPHSYTPPPMVKPTLLPLPKPDQSDSGPHTDSEKNRQYETDFDEKWNVVTDDQPQLPPGSIDDDYGDSNHQEEQQQQQQHQEPQHPPVPTKSLPATMVLVIGIIVAAFLAMILIVIIVLKMRTRVDNNIKCVRQASATSGGFPGPPPTPGGGTGAGSAPTAAPRYQFGSSASATMADGSDYGGSGGELHSTATTATTALMDAPRTRGAAGAGVPLLPTAASNANSSTSTGGFNMGSLGGFFALNGDRSRLFRKANGAKPVREWYV